MLDKNGILNDPAIFGLQLNVLGVFINPTNHRIYVMLEMSGVNHLQSKMIDKYDLKMDANRCKEIKSLTKGASPKRDVHTKGIEYMMTRSLSVEQPASIRTIWKQWEPDG